MPIAPINRAKTIAVPLNAGTGNDIVTVYESSGLTVGSELMPGYTIASYNVFVKNLKAFSQISSLPEISLPNFEPTDSETTKLYKTLNIEWGSARKQLNLFIGTSTGWHQVGSTSILNPSGYPFRVYSLLDLFTDNLYFELGENGKVGVQVQDVDYGLLSGDDLVVIHGSYVEEIFLKSQEPPITVNIGAPSPPPPPPPPSPTEMTMWLINTGIHIASINEKILMDARSFAAGPIYMPNNAAPGDYIKIMVIGSEAASLELGGAKYKGLETNTIDLTGMTETEFIFIYFGDDVGWTGNLPPT